MKDAFCPDPLMGAVNSTRSSGRGKMWCHSTGMYHRSIYARLTSHVLEKRASAMVPTHGNRLWGDFLPAAGLDEGLTHRHRQSDPRHFESPCSISPVSCSFDLPTVVKLRRQDAPPEAIRGREWDRPWVSLRRPGLIALQFAARTLQYVHGTGFEQHLRENSAPKLPYCGNRY